MDELEAQSEESGPVAEEPATQDKPVEADVESSTSIQDLPEDVWSINRKVNAPSESGVIRFAEDIDDYRSSVRSGRRAPSASKSGKGRKGTKSRKNR